MPPSSTETTDGTPSCWICLCEEPDEEGKLPLRDCSCRGDTGAGYAHVSCIVRYAKAKSNEAANNVGGFINNDEAFSKAWIICPRCEQQYQHELSIELANSFLVFLDEEYPLSDKNFSNQRRKMAALRIKAKAIMNSTTRTKDGNGDGSKSNPGNCGRSENKSV